MKTLYLDAFSGISGDMFIGALLDLGVDFETFKNELSKLKVKGFALSAEVISKCNIYGTNFDVTLDNGEQKDKGYIEERHNHHHGRHLNEILDLIQNSDLNDSMKNHAIAIFMDIGKAEAKVHNVPIDKVHFHEVGALDSIVDIVGACIAIELLNVDKIICSPISDGKGFINVAHGRMPVPVPAVAQMLIDQNIPIEQQNDIHTELLTPTGLGIVKEFVNEFDSFNKNYDIQKIGYGFGKRDTGSFNALRVYVLTNSLSSKTVVSSADEVVSIEANIDDTTGEILGNTMTELMDAGALDVYFTSIQMKKNRPGIKLSVLIEPTDFDKFVYLIFKNSSTIGVRYQTLNRIKMNREFEKVEVRGNFIRVKVLTYKDIQKKTVEFDDCLKVAKQTGRTFEEIYLEAQTKIKDM